MNKLSDIMKPIDERANFKVYFARQQKEAKLHAEKMAMKNSEAIIQRRIENRKAQF